MKKNKEQSNVVTRFINDYKRLKELVSDISDTLSSYIDEVDDNISKFEEYLGDYNIKLSGVVINVYDNHRTEINKLLDGMNNQIKDSEELKDLDEYINNIRVALQELDNLYDKGSLDEGEMEDVNYCLDMPFDDLETIFDDEGWDYE